MLLTIVFAKAGLNNEESALCKHHQRFGLAVQFSALVLDSTTYFQMSICTGQNNEWIPCLRKYSNVTCHAQQTSIII